MPRKNDLIKNLSSFKSQLKLQGVTLPLSAATEAAYSTRKICNGTSKPTEQTAVMPKKN